MYDRRKEKLKGCKLCAGRCYITITEGKGRKRKLIRKKCKCQENQTPD